MRPMTSLSVASRGTEIDILRVDDGRSDEMKDFGTIDLAEMYNRHGFEANIVHRDQAGENIAQVLLKHAFEFGADLLVTGAFGHSRAYDFIFGGVTNRLMKAADIPVLFSS